MWVAPILPVFLAASPDLVVETAFEDRYTDLIAESFNVAVRIGTLTDSRRVAHRLAASQRLLCASPAYLQMMSLASHKRPFLAQASPFGPAKTRAFADWIVEEPDKKPWLNQGSAD